MMPRLAQQASTTVACFGRRHRKAHTAIAGRSALVTGSTSGVGLSTAEALAEAGCNVVLNGFGEPAAINELGQSMARFGVTVFHVGADVTKPEEVRSMVATVGAKLGGIDILVNNAGIQHVSPIDSFARSWD